MTTDEKRRERTAREIEEQARFIEAAAAAYARGEYYVAATQILSAVGNLVFLSYEVGRENPR